MDPTRRSMACYSHGTISRPTMAIHAVQVPLLALDLQILPSTPLLFWIYSLFKRVETAVGYQVLGLLGSFAPRSGPRPLAVR